MTEGCLGGPLPGVNHQQAIRAFQKAGFHIARQGKHITMTNGERIRWLNQYSSPAASMESQKSHFAVRTPPRISIGSSNQMYGSAAVYAGHFWM